MNKQDLINALLALPEDVTDICIFDTRKNAYNSDEEPNGIGVQLDFTIEHIPKDISGKPLGAIIYKNDDYDDEANVNHGSLLFSNIATKIW